MKYDPILPRTYNLPSYTKKEANVYFTGFVSTIPGRTEIVKSEINEILPQWVADYSESSMMGVGTWLKAKAKARRYSKEELEHIVRTEKLTGHLAQWTLEMTTTLDTETICKCNNAGAYFTEALRRAVKGTEWTICSKRGTEDFNFPVLAQMIKPDKRYYPELNPIVIGLSFGNKFVEFDSRAEIILDAFDRWRSELQSGYQPKTETTL